MGAIDISLSRMLGRPAVGTVVTIVAVVTMGCRADVRPNAVPAITDCPRAPPQSIDAGQPDAERFAKSCSAAVLTRRAELCGVAPKLSDACADALQRTSRGESATVVDDLLSECSRSSFAIGRYCISQKERYLSQSSGAYAKALVEVADAAREEGLAWLEAVVERDLGLVAFASSDDVGGRAHLIRGCELTIAIPYRPLPTEVGSHPCSLMSGSSNAGRESGNSMYLKWSAIAAGCKNLSVACPEG